MKKLNLSELKVKSKSGKSKTRNPRKFFFRVFDFEYWTKIEKSERKKSERNFRRFRVFDLALFHYIMLRQRR